MYDEEYYEKQERQIEYRKKEVYGQLTPEQRKKIDKSRSFITMFRLISGACSYIIAFIIGWIVTGDPIDGLLGLLGGVILMTVCFFIAPLLPFGRQYRFFCNFCKDPYAKWSELRKVLSD